MSTELKMLVWTSGLTALLWLPYILSRIMTAGPARTVTYQADDDPLPGWAQRAKRAHYNAIENLVPFGLLVVAAHLVNISTPATVYASVIYFCARVVHYLGFISGLPLVRTVSFAVGWICTLVFFLALVT
ncbi:MAG: MAPEG family protein [Parvibaculaceae bacterium]|jgi:uncharacterized MAPEG superfamily protein